MEVDRLPPSQAGAELRSLGSPLGRLWLRLRERLFRQLSLLAPSRLDVSWVTDALALGGAFDGRDVRRLAALGIAAVVDVRLEAVDDARVLERHGVHLLHLPTPDGHELSQEDLRRGVNWISAQLAERKKVLVHCAAGVGRSPLLVSAVLVSEGKTAAQALGQIRARRWQVAPNDRQLEALLEFEAGHSKRSQGSLS